MAVISVCLGTGAVNRRCGWPTAKGNERGAYFAPLAASVREALVATVAERGRERRGDATTGHGKARFRGKGPHSWRVSFAQIVPASMQLNPEALKPQIGHNIGFQAPISPRSAPDQHGRQVEYSTQYVLGGAELRNARKLVKNDVEVAGKGES